MCFTTQSYAHPLEVENHESCCINTQCFGTGTIISMRDDCYHGRVDDELKEKRSKQLLVKQKVIPKRMQQSRQRSFEKQTVDSNDQSLYQSVSHCRCKRPERNINSHNNCHYYLPGLNKKKKMRQKIYDEE